MRRLLKPGALGQGMAPVGTLADFLEVSGAHEGVVDEFLREELNYVVVESWVAAEEGVRLLKSGVDGRATFLIHSDAQGALFEESEDAISEPGLTPLQGLDPGAERLWPVAGVDPAQAAARLPGRGSRRGAAAGRAAIRYAYFLTPEGECFHNATVTGGKPASEGPLALKRELREAESRLAKLETGLAQAETEAAALTQTIEELTAQLEARSEERRQAETETRQPGRGAEADGGRGAAHRAAACRSGRRRPRATRTRARPSAPASSRSARRPQRLEAEHAHGRGCPGCSCRPSSPLLRQKREGLQQEAAQVTAELAGLEERRRGAEAAFQRIDRLHADLERRVLAIEQQRAAAEAERDAAHPRERRTGPA